MFLFLRLHAIRIVRRLLLPLPRNHGRCSSFINRCSILRHQYAIHLDWIHASCSRKSVIVRVCENGSYRCHRERVDDLGLDGCFIVYQSIQRLYAIVEGTELHRVDEKVMFVIAVLGLAINITLMAILGHDQTRPS